MSLMKELKDYTQSVQEELRDIQNSQVSNVSWIDFIERYIKIFYNKNKKITYYKNNILSLYFDLLWEEKYDKASTELINKELIKLRNLDLKAYNSIKDFEKNLALWVLTSYNRSFIVPKMIYLELLSGSALNNQERSWFYIYSFSLFSEYQALWKFSYNMFDSFSQAFRQWFEKVEESSNQAALQSTQTALRWDSENISLRFEYFAFFLSEQVQLFLNEEFGVYDLSFSLNTLENYLNTSMIAYDNTSTSQVTQIHNFNEVFNKLNLYIREHYFRKERNSNNLLVIHSKKTLTNTHLQELNDVVNIMRSFYRESEKYLDSAINSRDKALSESWEDNINKVTEYYSALWNYTSYISEYDLVKKEALKLETYSEVQEEDLTKKDIIEYLSQFKGINMNYALIKVIDNYYYEVKNVRLQGQKLDFEIFPYENYKIQSIVFDGEELSFQYKLETIESKWEENYRRASRDKKENYDFSRFFTNVFFAEKKSTAVDFVADNSEAKEEDRAIIVLKRDKLLGEEFAHFKNLKPAYFHLNADKNGENFLITMQDVPFSYSTMVNGKSIGYAWLLQGEYIFTDTSHHFKNTKITLQRQTNSRSRGQEYLFDGNEIILQGNVHVKDIESEIEKIIYDLSMLEKIYLKLNKLDSLNIVITYLPVIKKMQIKLVQGEKKYTILAWEGIIETILRNNTVIARKLDDINLLDQYIGK